MCLYLSACRQSDNVDDMRSLLLYCIMNMLVHVITCSTRVREYSYSSRSRSSATQGTQSYGLLPICYDL